MSLLVQPERAPIPLYVCVVAITSVTSLPLDSQNALARCLAFLRMLGGNPDGVSDVLECLDKVARMCRRLVEMAEQTSV